MTRRFGYFSELEHYLYAVDWMLEHRFRKKAFSRLVKQRGGRCSICNGRRGLQFHHTSGDKEGNVADFDTFHEMKKEAKKCILICAECHDRLHEMEDEKKQEVTENDNPIRLSDMKERRYSRSGGDR